MELFYNNFSNLLHIFVHNKYYQLFLVEIIKQYNKEDITMELLNIDLLV